MKWPGKVDEKILGYSLLPPAAGSQAAEKPLTGNGREAPTAAVPPAAPFTAPQPSP